MTSQTIIRAVCLTTEELLLVERLIEEIKEDSDDAIGLEVSPSSEGASHRGEVDCAPYDITGTKADLEILVDSLQDNEIDFISYRDIY